MLVWFAGMSFVIVWAVFRDASIDYRMVMIGAVAPELVDAFFGGPKILHTLSGAVLVLAAVMLATIGRRESRRRFIFLAIGVLLHLVLDGVWNTKELFWWPAFGLDFPETKLPSLERSAGVVIAMELAGLAALAWAARRFGLDEVQRRKAFVLTGRLDRALVAEEPPTC